MKPGKLLLILFIFMSCSPNDSDEPVILPEPTEKVPTIPLVFFDNFINKSVDYKAVKIGEYLWMNSNINHYPGQPFTKADIELVLKRYRLDPQALKNVSIADINKYCGPYYDRNRFEYLEDRGKCVIYEGEEKILTSGWGAPSTTDFRQLFAMCGNATEQDIRHSLTVEAGDNPIAIAGLTYWFGNNNINKYGFNLMPGGARFNGPQVWGLKHNHDGTDTEYFDAVAGDFYGFIEAVLFQTWDGRVAIHDYPEGISEKLWHWMPVRWCRKLTKEELGYKLYINTEQTDIKKLALNQSAPKGYTELANGYIRGFYVQFILDNPNPLKTVTQIVDMAKYLR